MISFLSHEDADGLRTLNHFSQGDGLSYIYVLKKIPNSEYKLGFLSTFGSPNANPNINKNIFWENRRC